MDNLKIGLKIKGGSLHTAFMGAGVNFDLTFELGARGGQKYSGVEMYLNNDQVLVFRGKECSIVPFSGFKTIHLDTNEADSKAKN